MLLAGYLCFYLGGSIGLTVDLIISLAISDGVLIAEEVAVGLSGWFL